MFWKLNINRKVFKDFKYAEFDNLELSQLSKISKRFKNIISLNGEGENAKEECGKESEYILN